MYGESHKDKTIFFLLESELPYNINLDLGRKVIPIVRLLQGLGLVYFIKMNGLCVLHNSTPDVMHVKSGDTDYNW
jgi:hypothetical protein